VCLFSRTPESYPACTQFKKGRAQEKKSELIHHQMLAVVTAPVAQCHRAAPHLHSCSPGIPLTRRIVERRTGMQSRGIRMVLRCPTSLAVCKTNTVTCSGVVVSLQPFLNLIKKILEKSL